MSQGQGEWTYRVRRFWWTHFSPGTRLTSLIVWSAVAAYACQLYFFYRLRSAWVDDTFALSRAGLASGAYWQLLTYAWLHSVVLPIHILFNMAMVYSLGRELEWPLGPWRYLVLYIGSVLAAAFVWLAWTRSPDAGIEGASGAVFGLLAAFACYDPQRVLKVWILFLVPVVMRARTLALVTIGFEVVCQAMGWLHGIAHLGHLGGAAFGFLAMQFWKVRRPPSPGIDSFLQTPPHRPESPGSPMPPP